MSAPGAAERDVDHVVPGWAGQGLAHEGFFFDDPGQMLGRCIPFIEEGIDLGQPVLVVASAPVTEALTDVLGERRSALAALEPAEAWWRGPHDTMTAYVEMMAPLRRAGAPWRLVAEPVWLGLPGGRYWSRFEAVANVSLGDHPFYSLCLHDHRRLDAATTAEARCTHPRVVDATDPGAASCWEGAAAFLAAVEPSPMPKPNTAKSLAHATLRSVRHHVHALGTRAGLADGRITEIALVVDELAANALALVDQVTVAGWIDGTDLIVEVSDGGPGLDDPFAGYVLPPAASERGRGLWIARALSDDLVISATTAGTVIQVLVHLT